MGLMSKLKKNKTDADEPLADDATEDSLNEGAGADPPKKSKGKKKSKDAVDKKEKAAGGGAKQFFIDHGEKLGLAAVGVCLLLMVWSAVGRERLADNRSPDNLEARASSRQNEIESSQLPNIGAGAQTFHVMMVEGLKPIDEGFLIHDGPWKNDGVVGTKPTAKRGDPEILPPESPVAVPGGGLFALNIEKDLLGDSFLERERLKREKELEEKRLEEEEQARLLREKRAKEKAERDKKRKRTSSRDRKREKEEAERRALREQNRQPEQTEWPLPEVFAQEGFNPPEQIKDGEVGAAGKYWVVVNALAPRYKQQKLYDEIFLNAVGYNPERDRPDYLGVRLARLEIPEDAGDAPLDWSQAKEWAFSEQIAALKKDQEAWLGEAQPVISDAFYHDKLTQPLGPLLLESWERWAAHPEVMLKGEESLLGPTEEGAEEELESEEEKSETKDPFDFDAPDDQVEDPRGGRRTPRPVAPRAGRPSDEMLAAQYGPGAGGRVTAEISQSGKFYQVRVFDFSVEAGKRYRYRVQLAIRNPNSEKYGSQAVPPAFLANTQTQKTPWKATDWSEPTNLAVVPLGREAFASTVNLPEEDDPFNEPYATVLTRVINFGKGSLTTALFDVYRGGMVNGITEGFEIDPIQKLVKRQSDSLIETDLLLLDMRGGPVALDEDPQLALNEGRPAEMLFLDAKGNLHVRSQLDDAEEMIKYKMIAGEDVSVGGFNELPPDGVGPPIPGVGPAPGDPGGFEFFEQEGRRR